MKKLPKGWKKIASVTREGRSFYLHPKKRIAIVQSFDTDKWLIMNNKYSIIGTAKSAAAAFRSLTKVKK